MTLLADHDLWAVTLDVLRTEGHDIVTAAEIGLAQAPDRTFLKEAAARQQFLLTRDRDFGRLVFAEGHQDGGAFSSYRTVDAGDGARGDVSGACQPFV